MRPDVHAAALRSAAKLVLGMASLATLTAACAAAGDEEASTGSEAVTAKTDADGGDDDASATTDAGAPTKCEATLNAAFPGPDKYQWTPVKEPKEVVECCNEELSSKSWPHRWSCCVAYDKLDKNGNPLTVMGEGHGMACTPWGPPVPPRMNRARKASPARRDMNLALAQWVA